MANQYLSLSSAGSEVLSNKNISSFLDLDIRSNYDSENHDMLNEFYIPVLTEARKYDRLAGFFSSSALAVAARGISEFIINNGHMRLLVGARLYEADVRAIKEGKENPEKLISEMMLDDLQNFENELIRDYVRALGWLVAKKYLDIKVALVIDNDGMPLDYETSIKRGVFHQKVGILEDNDGNLISFSGSINESATAWENNIEEFKVFRSWIDGEIQHLASDKSKFERYWSGDTNRLRIMDVPNAVQNRLIELAPNDLRSLKLSQRGRRPVLRDYQRNAIAAWIENSGKGILEMATATGKTYTAIGCLDELLKKYPEMMVVITCPFIHLIKQWKDNLNVFGLSCIEAFGSSETWENRLTNSIFDLNNGIMDTLIVVTTHDTFSSEKFIKAMNSVTRNAILIADEVHGIGSPGRRKGLMNTYRFRLGLSATPTRWFDEEGTKILYDFFKKTVFEFSLDQAIKSGYLSPYQYEPYIVELSSDEMIEYRKMTRKIAHEYSKAKGDARKNELFELFCILRQKIVTNAKRKFQTFEKILDSIEDIKHCLIYCSPEQIQIVQNMLNNRGIIQHKFTAEENAKERKLLLDDFDRGTYRALVAMKCLDEGVDVPSTRMAIILASSGNPREFIQRRGRILRLHEGKDKAIIHDIIVVPTEDETIDPEYYDLEQTIMKREIRRYVEFAKSALNSGLAYDRIQKYASKYRVRLE